MSLSKEQFFSILDGRSFADLSVDLGISQPSVRSSFLRIMSRDYPNIWNEGMQVVSSRNQWAASPSIAWFRENKERILNILIFQKPRKTTSAAFAASILVSGLSHSDVCDLLNVTSWRLYEMKTGAKPIKPALYEYFLLKTGQTPLVLHPRCNGFYSSSLA